MRFRDGSLKRGSVCSFENRGSVILYSSAVGLEDEELPFGTRCLGNGIVWYGLWLCFRDASSSSKKLFFW